MMPASGEVESSYALLVSHFTSTLTSSPLGALPSVTSYHRNIVTCVILPAPNIDAIDTGTVRPDEG
jgi:hypothetical protein